MEFSLKAVVKYASEVIDGIWEFRYPAGIVSAAVIYLAASDSWASYNNKARVNSDVETIMACADFNGDGDIDNSEKMRVLLKAFPNADKAIQGRVKSATRIASSMGGYGALDEYYSELVGNEFWALLNGGRSDMFPLTHTEREQTLAKVAASYTQQEKRQE